MVFSTGAELLLRCAEGGVTIGEAMLERERTLFGASTEDVMARMGRAWAVMNAAARRSIDRPARSMGGLIGGEARRIFERAESHPPACGALVARAAAYAMGMLEVNASMGVIVAAPTAGSCGVLPGVLIALQQAHGFADGDVLGALLNASAVGYLIMLNATVAGAEGGCQAEVGSACAMAASAAVQIMGGDPETCLHAAALALSGLLGLVCDPIGALVESPCQIRNAIGASSALTCAEVALSGVRSVVPFDEVVDAMLRVGQSLPRELRETALGGLAACPCVRHMGPAAPTAPGR